MRKVICSRVLEQEKTAGETAGALFDRGPPPGVGKSRITLRVPQGARPLILDSLRKLECVEARCAFHRT